MFPTKDPQYTRVRLVVFKPIAIGTTLIRFTLVSLEPPSADLNHGASGTSDFFFFLRFNSFSKKYVWFHVRHNLILNLILDVTRVKLPR